LDAGSEESARWDLDFMLCSTRLLRCRRALFATAILFLAIGCASHKPVATKPTELAFSDVESLLQGPSKSERARVRQHNAAITDREIEAWMLFSLLQPDALRMFQAHTPEARAAWLREYRKDFDGNGMEIPVLRNYSAAQLILMRLSWGEQITARAKIQNTSARQHQHIIQACAALIAQRLASPLGQKHPLWTQLYSAPELAFLNPDLLRISDDQCWIYLHKGVGKGIGFEVSKHFGKWTIASFDEYQSWQRKEIYAP
jgi:hypothetical protein